MLERKTVVDQIEICRDGAVRIRMALLIVDGSTELNSRWHRTSVGPGGDAAAQMQHVNDHLVQMGEAQLDAAAVDDIVAYCAKNVEMLTAKGWTPTPPDVVDET